MSEWILIGVFMSCSKLKIICFSPTRTTRRILDAIAEGIEADSVEIMDVTRSDKVPGCYGCSDDDLVIIGAPVYSGRIPVAAVERFSALKAAGTAVVPVVVYGNRAYEDALLELADLTDAAGFKAIAAAAFIGEHSFSNEKTPIAVSRPDAVDLQKAREFGRRLSEIYTSGDFNKSQSIEIPGNNPYKARSPKASASPISDDNCELCGSCERVCPTDAITVGSLVETDPEKCIFCCACVKVCAFDARQMTIPKILEVSKWLADNFSERREPEIFV